MELIRIRTAQKYPMLMPTLFLGNLATRKRPYDSLATLWTVFAHLKHNTSPVIDGDAFSPANKGLSSYTHHVAASSNSPITSPNRSTHRFGRQDTAPGVFNLFNPFPSRSVRRRLWPMTLRRPRLRHSLHVVFFFSFFFFNLTYSRWTSSLPSCLWSRRIFPSLPGSCLTIFLSRCKVSTLTTRQPMVEFYLLTFPRFPLRKKEQKFYFGKNRTHDFRTSRCADYLLDHSGDDKNHILNTDLCLWTPLLSEDARRQACVLYKGRCCNCGSTEHSLRWSPAPFRNTFSLLNPVSGTHDPDGSIKKKPTVTSKKHPSRPANLLLCLLQP